MEYQQYLPYLIPPLLGGVIGYVTNYIAIRMLFRPLRPWRLVGIRVPLTPGIIPSKRGELARKMGEMVGEHLLTVDDVGRANILRAPRQLIAAVGAARRRHEAGSGERFQQLADRRRCYSSGPGDLSRTADGRRFPRQVGQHDGAVVREFANPEQCSGLDLPDKGLF